MQFTTIATILFSAAMVSAAPKFVSGNEEGAQANVCGNGQHLACCSTNGDGNAQLVAGLNCLSVPIIAVPVEQACGSNVAACCPHSGASGALPIQLECDPIPL